MYRLKHALRAVVDILFLHEPKGAARGQRNNIFTTARSMHALTNLKPPQGHEWTIHHYSNSLPDLLAALFLPFLAVAWIQILYLSVNS